MSTRKLKRNISNDPNNDLSLKKPKLRKPLQLQHTYAYETPHPTASSQSEVYKLPSSVGERMSPSNFSPIPKAPQIIAKTSSTNLKENASAASPFRKDRHPIIKKKYTTKKKNTTQTRALESPLYPSSPAVISSRDGTYESSPEQPMTFAQNPESPPTLYKPKSIARRPSAPTPPRKSDWKELKVGIPTNGSAVDLLHDDKNDTDTRISLFTAATSPEEVFHRAPNHSPINFNRPPSQLSLYDYNRSITYSPQQGGDGFFSNIRGESTPFNTIRSPLRSPSWATRFFRDGGITAISDTDTDSDSSGGGGGVLDDSDSDFDMETGKSDSIFSSLKKASRARARSHGSGYVTPSEDDDEGSEQPSRVPRSPWIDDSLISAPDTRDWRLLPRSARSPRYMRGEKELKKDVDMEKSILEGMFESLLIDDKGPSTASKFCDDAPPPPPMIMRTRSLGDTHDLDLSQNQNEHQSQANTQAPKSLARRTRSGTVVQAQKADSAVSSTHALAPALPVISSAFRRTRSGTIILSSGKAQQEVTSDTSISSPSAATTSASSRTRRTRSGTVIASASAANSTTFDEPPPPAPRFATVGIGRKRSGSIMQVPTLESVGEGRQVVSATGIEAPPRTRTVSGRTRSGSTVLQALLPTLPSVGEGESTSSSEGGDVSPLSRSSRTVRSGSVQGVGAGIKAALGKLPIPGSGMLGRMSVGSAGRALPAAPPLPPVLTFPALDRDTEMMIAEASSPDTLEDTLEAKWSPFKKRHQPPRGKRKGYTGTNTIGRKNSIAMDADEDELSDDPLLLKSGDRFD